MNNEIESILEEIKEKRDLIESKTDDFSKEELKMIFQDVFDGLIYLYGTLNDLPSLMVKTLESKNEKEKAEEDPEEKEKRIKELNFYIQAKVYIYKKYLNI